MSNLGQIYLKNLTLYHQALLNTRLDYLKLMEDNLTTSDELKQIWDASFVLKYMIASNQKYMEYIEQLNALNNLNLDSKMQAYLNSIYQKVGKSTDKDIKTFMADAQQLLTSEEFKSSFSTFADTNIKKYMFSSLGTLILFGLSFLIMCGVAVAVAPIASSGLFLLLVSAISFALTTWVAVEANRAKRYSDCATKQTDVSNFELDSNTEFECSDSYTYECSGNDGSHTRITKGQEHKKEKIGDLKSKFFQSPGSQSALTTNSIFKFSISGNVTKNYNSLVELEQTLSPG